MASPSFNQSPSSAASTSSPTQWDVFLSFRGIDTRFTFTDHLYHALHRNGIKTFRDDPELRTGEVISDALLQAIQKSKTFVIVLSENYAYSRWCLDELVEIINCYNEMRRLIIPVFYNIDPSAVGHQTGSFEKAFQKHETGYDKETLEKWRVALTTMGKISGKVCKNMYEADVIDDIVEEILLEINPKTLDVAKYAVGLGPRVKEITSLLSSDTEGVIRIGIFGMGGVGKTTLAKALYNQLLLRSFKGSCFLANVREVSRTIKGLVSLQQQLIDDILKSKKLVTVSSVEEGTKFIRERICSEKILVLIDDVDDLNQYEALVGPFASGSVVINTTRDEEILDKIEVEPRYRYRANVLDDAESLALFTQYAFGNANPDNNLKVLSTKILRLAGGLPLALKVFGSYLSTQSEVGWESYIKKLQRTPNNTILQKLLISLNAVELDDPMLKKMFLDIACFFIGRPKEEVVKILETYYLYADHNIDILKKRCLLSINNDEVLEMHDLLRDMGREVARNNSTDEPGKHSRLWVWEDICDVLKNNKGTEAIEGVIYCYKHRNGSASIHSFAAETFKRMIKLRFLYLEGVDLTGSFEHTFEDLRWLSWKYCPLKCFPSEFKPQTLVVLELPFSKMMQIWEPEMASLVYENLKTLNMSNSRDLTTTPDFTKLPNLENLKLQGCQSLVELHISIGSLRRLVSLDLGFCIRLKRLPHTICNLRALQILSIGNCDRLEAFPVEFGNMKSLKVLNAGRLAVSFLPNSIGRLTELVLLTLSNNKNLKTLPGTIGYMRALKVLDFGNCTSLETLPEELGNIGSLNKLYAPDLAVSKLPDSIGRLSKLVELRLLKNKNLKTLPDTICQLRSLEILDINCCSSLEALPAELGNIESLKMLNVQAIAVSKLPNSIGRLSNLVKLKLGYNYNLKTLPDTICNLSSLEILYIDGCRSLEALPEELGNIRSLKELHVRHARAVSKLPVSIGRLSNLVELRLSSSENLKTLPDTISNLRSLKILDIDYCSSLEALPAELGNIESLKELHVKDIAVSKLPDSIGRLTKLVELSFRGNKTLKTLPNTICKMRSLKVLNISCCENIEILPHELWKITSLRELHASSVTMLKRLPPYIESIQIASSLKELDLSNNVFTALPSGISQLSSLDYLNLGGCCRLLTISELPSNLKRISADGCKSLKRLLVFNSEKLAFLYLTDCNALTEIQGLNRLTCIEILNLAGCNPTIAYAFTRRLFQIFSEFRRCITICMATEEFPDWISQSRDWIQSTSTSTMSLDLPPNVSYNLLAMILCVKPLGDNYYRSDYDNFYQSKHSIKVITSNSSWSGYISESHGAQIKIIPTSILSVTGDDQIVVTAGTDLKLVGICLLYKTSYQDSSAVPSYNN